MKKIQVFAALLLFAFTLKAQSPIETAKGLIVNENYGKAKEVLTQYIGTEKEPLKQAEAYYWLGESEYRDLIDDNQAKAFEKAREQYNKGIAAAKSSPHCQVGMSKLLLDAKNGKEALKTFDQAIKDSRKKPFKEGHPEIFMLIGDSYLNCTQKNPDQAVSYYTRARDVEPTNGLTWLKLGDGNLAKGDAGAAMSAFESASQKDKSNADIFLKMGRIWKRASKNDLAEEQFKNGLKVNPQYAPIYKDLIELYMDTKKYDQVLPTLEKYIPLAGNDFSARRRLVTFLTYQAKDYDRAVVEAQKLLKDDPTQTTMYRWIAWAKCSKADMKLAESKGVLGDDAKLLYQEGRDASKKLFEVVPADRLVYYDYEFPAKAALRMGDMDEASKLYKKVVELDSTKKCDYYTQFMGAFYAAKKYKEGLDLLTEKEGTTCKVESSEYYNAMYYALGAKLYDQAIVYADKYSAAQPTLTDPMMIKGRALVQLDSEVPTWKAKDVYEKLIATYEAKPSDRGKPHVATAYNYIGTYYGSQQDLVKAREFFQKTLTVDAANKTATEMIQQLDAAAAPVAAPIKNKN
jgi:tetratricopeptide (TPR) repeat protein